MLNLFINKPLYGKSRNGFIQFKANPNGETGIQITNFSDNEKTEIEITTSLIAGNTYKCSDATIITRKEFLAKLKEAKKKIRSIRP